MRTYELDGRLLGGESEAAHAHLMCVLPLPPHYGRNLDALWDCLTEITEETTLCIRHVDAMTVTTEGTLLLQTLSDAAEENPRVHIRWLGRVDDGEGEEPPTPCGPPRALLINGSPHREGRFYR